ncbi:MAG TPA: PAS domain S-box protein [Anaerolineales bacterium]|nr:PAS domain S-box protein [Anaerolineales bacterium]
MNSKPIEVLLIEDNPGDARRVTEMLKQGTGVLGLSTFHLTHIEQLNDGLRRLADTKFDIILADLSLPGSRGLDTFHRLREVAPELPLIVLSSSEGDMALAVQAVREGAQDYLNKARVDNYALTRAIRHAIERKQAEVERERLLNVLEASLNEIYIFSPGTLRFEYVNAGALHNLGYTLEALHQMTPLDLKPEFTEAAFREMIGPLLRREKSVHVFETIHRRADASLYPVEVHLQLVERETEPVFLAVINDITERKQAEEALRTSEIKYRLLVEQLPAITYTMALDEPGSTLYVSPQIESILGYSVAEWISDPQLWLKALHPDDRERVLAENAHTLATGEPIRSETRLLARDGRVVWLRDEATVIRNETGQPQFLQGVMIDITERKQAEEAVRASEARYRSLFEDSPISLWEEDFAGVKAEIDHLRREGVTDFRHYFEDHPEAVARCVALVRVTDVNKAALELYRAGSKEELLSNLDRVFTPESYSIFQEELITIAEGQAVFASEGINRSLSDEAIHISLKWSAMPGYETTLSKVIVSLIDITQRKRAEEGLRLQSAALESAANAIVITDREGNITWANPAFTHLTGYAPAEAVGKNPRFLKSGRQDEAFYRNLWDTILAGQSWQGELVNRRSDGTLYTEEMTITPVRDETGAIKNFIAIQQDITERKQAEEHIQYQATLLQNVSDAIIATDTNFIIRSWNKAAEAMFGYSAEEVIGRPERDVLAYDYIGVSQAEVAAQLLQAGEWNGEAIVYRKDGRPVHTLGSMSLVKDDSGTVKGILAVSHDITARKRAEQALERRVYQLGILHVIATASAEAFSEDVLIERVTRIIGDTFYPDNFGFLLLNSAGDAVVTHPSYRGVDEHSQNTFPLGQGIVGRVAAAGQPLRVPDVTREPAYIPVVPQMGSELCVPIKIGQRVIGVINAEARKLDAFSEDDERLLLTVAGQMATAIQKARLFAALQTSELQYRSLVEQLPAITYEVMLGDVNRTTYISPRLETILGFTPEEWMADPDRWIRQIHPDDRKRVVAVVRETDARAESLDLEYRALARDGRVVWLRNQYAFVEGAPGKPAYIHGVMLDITERMQAEEALRQSEARYRAVVEDQTELICRFLPDGTHTFVNNAYCRYFGEEREEILHRSFLTWALPDERARLEKYLSSFTPENPVGTFEQYDVTPDGQVRWRMWTDRAIFDSQGRLVEFQATGRDITDRKQRERELEAIATVSAALRTASTRADMLPIILDQLLELLHAEGAGLAMRDPLTGETVIERAIGKWSAWSGIRLPSGEGVSGQVIATGQPYISAHVETEPRMTHLDLLEGLRAVACIPLIAQGETIGALWVGRKDNITPGEVRLLTAIADIAANAIRRTGLHEETRRHAEQLAVINRLGRALSETLELPQIYDQFYQAIGQLLPDIATVFISTYDPERQIITCAHAVHDGDPLNAAELPPIPLEPPGGGPQSESIRTRQPVIVNDLVARLQKARTNVTVGTPGPVTQSALYVPMMVKGEVTGVVQVQSYTANRFAEADAELLNFVANAAAIAIENARLFAETQRRLDRLQALRAIDSTITASLDIRITLNTVLDQTMAQLGVDAADVLLLRPHMQILEYVAGRGFHTRAIERSALRVGEGLAGRAALERRHMSVANLGESGSVFKRSALLAEEGFVAHHAVPIIAKGGVKGVLEVFHRAPLAADHEWVEFIETLAGQAAIAIENGTLFNDLQRSNVELALAYGTTLEGWSRALDLRDQETEGHTQRVTEMTLRLGRAMGLSENELVHMRRGALLHDIGKMGVPDSILRKPGPLSDEEWVIMRKHPAYAYNMLLPIAYLRPALDIPYSHHERWDGSGYPQGLKGLEIPLAARIFAVADVWDALRSDRPYRAAWPEAQVREYVINESGRLFDSQVVEVFLKMLD